ncbi:MAG: 23S rRNA (adenine(2503)-C(2))-methyltransferase RlmN [Bacteroidales bacterium]|nr:23S rRNA (adenine(2503)-C(2))-methyltransferase RlmN [Bacteroidales bacterium]
MNGNSRPDIRSLTKLDLEHFFLNQGEKKFRVNQVYDWLWKKASRSFEDMTSLSKVTRQLLQQNFSFHTAICENLQQSVDGTVKAVFRLYDGSVIEGVVIPAGDRITVCISSQVGCALDCKFCATGKMGFTRNLTTGEIFDQVTLMSEMGFQSPNPQSRISNIVFMGMGEPFMNYDNMVGAIEKITSPDGLGMSPQRITVSSVGIPKMVIKMADDDPRYHFALSLHAATDEKRNMIIPFNLRHPLQDLTESLKYYQKKTGKRFTIEYILFGNFNDSIADARDLATFCKSFPVKINIIEYNPVEGSGFSKSDPDRTRAFVEFLERRNLVINVRQSRGKDILAACGQLAAKQLQPKSKQLLKT